GSCRTVKDGLALSMTAWIMFDDEKLVDTLVEVMPGVKVEPWRSVSENWKGAKANGTTATIVGDLGGLPADVDRVSVRQLKKETGRGGMDLDTFRGARDAAFKLVPWHIDGQWLARTFTVAADG